MACYFSVKPAITSCLQSPPRKWIAMVYCELVLPNWLSNQVLCGSCSVSRKHCRQRQSTQLNTEIVDHLWYESTCCPFPVDRSFGIKSMVENDKGVHHKGGYASHKMEISVLCSGTKETQFWASFIARPTTMEHVPRLIAYWHMPYPIFKTTLDFYHSLYHGLRLCRI